MQEQDSEKPKELWVREQGGRLSFLVPAPVGDRRPWRALARILEHASSVALEVPGGGPGFVATMKLGWVRVEEAIGGNNLRVTVEANDPNSLLMLKGQVLRYFEEAGYMVPR